MKCQGKISVAPDAEFVTGGMGQCRNSSGKTNPIANATQSRATATQFALKAMSFCADGDGELNQQELTQVAAAVIDELQLRQQRSGSFASNSFLRIKQGAATDTLSEGSTTSRMPTVFVCKALSYDKDANGTLDARDTKARDSALIRTLG